MPNGFALPFGLRLPFSISPPTVPNGGGPGGLFTLMAGIEKTVQSVVTAPLSGLGIKPSQLPPGPMTLISQGLPVTQARAAGAPARTGRQQVAPTEAVGQITVV